MGKIAPKIVLLLLAMFILFWWFGGCKPKLKELPGSYKSEDRTNNTVYELHADGTFIRYEEGHATIHGLWQVTDQEYLFDTGIRLDEPATTSPDGLKIGGFSGEYLLTTRGGKICWQVHEDTEYWCKI